MLLAPWQKLVFNATVAEVVRDLIGRAAVAANLEKRNGSKMAAIC
jgi:hypothetical protein